MIAEQTDDRKRKVVFGCLFVFLMVTAIITLGGLFLMSSPSIWQRWNAASISLDGRLSEGSAAYRAKNGDILLSLQRSDATKPFFYVIKPGQSQLGIPPSQSLLFPFPGHVYSYQTSLVTVPLDGTEAKMEQCDAGLVLKPYGAEFTSLQKERVQVRW